MIRRLLALTMVLVLTLLVLVVFGVVTVLAAAADATGPDPAQIAAGLVLIWGLVAPWTVYKLIPLDDAHMKLLTVGASFAIGIIALAVAHQLSINLGSLGSIAATASLIYGESQLVWNLLKDQPNPKLAGLVTEPKTP